MAKKATKKAAAAAATTGGLIDSSRYDRSTFIDPKTGKTRHSVSNNDAVAVALRHIAFEKLDTVARANKIEDFVGKEFSNSGQRRMALGNRLRAAVRRHVAGKGDPVIIGEFTIKSLTTRVPEPDGVKKPAKSAKKATKAKKPGAETQAAA